VEKKKQKKEKRSVSSKRSASEEKKKQKKEKRSVSSKRSASEEKKKLKKEKRSVSSKRSASEEKKTQKKEKRSVSSKRSASDEKKKKRQKEDKQKHKEKLTSASSARSGSERKCKQRGNSEPKKKKKATASEPKKKKQKEKHEKQKEKTAKEKKQDQSSSRPDELAADGGQKLKVSAEEAPAAGRISQQEAPSPAVAAEEGAAGSGAGNTAGNSAGNAAGNAAAFGGPKFAFGFAKSDRKSHRSPERGPPTASEDAVVSAAAAHGERQPMSREAVDALFDRHRGIPGAWNMASTSRRRSSAQVDARLLDRRSFTKEELTALVAMAGRGFESIKKAAADGSGVAASLHSTFSLKRKLGLAEKALLQAVLEPPEPDFSLSPCKDLLKALSLVVVPRPPPPEPPPPPQLLLPAGPEAMTPSSPSANSLTVAKKSGPDAVGYLPRRHSIPLEEWPPPSGEAVQRMLSRFPHLDGHCRGTLLNLPPQFALAILWDMDAKGGSEEIRDPQGFIFSAAQTLQSFSTMTTAMPMPAPAMLPQAPMTLIPAPQVFAVQQ